MTYQSDRLPLPHLGSPSTQPSSVTTPSSEALDTGLGTSVPPYESLMKDHRESLAESIKEKLKTANGEGQVELGDNVFQAKVNTDGSVTLTDVTGSKQESVTITADGGLTPKGFTASLIDSLARQQTNPDKQPVVVGTGPLPGEVAPSAPPAPTEQRQSNVPTPPNPTDRQTPTNQPVSTDAVVQALDNDPRFKKTVDGSGNIEYKAAAVQASDGSQRTDVRINVAKDGTIGMAFQGSDGQQTIIAAGPRSWQEYKPEEVIKKIQELITEPSTAMVHH